MHNFAQIAKPLTSTLEKDQSFHWTIECQHAFDTLRANLGTTTKLTLPDFSRPFRVSCDARGVALGAALSQLNETGKERPIAFASRILPKKELKWGVTKREAYAIVWSRNYFRSYLLGNKFELFTDHHPLVFLRKLKNPSSKIARWLLQLEEYDYTVTYREGKANSNADATSRLPIYENGDDDISQPGAGISTLDVISITSILNLDDIREAQQNDDIVQNVIKLEYNSDEKVTISKEMRSFVDKLDEFFIDDAILYRQVYEGHIQVILPPSLHDKVLMLPHQNPTGGHLGVNRTVARFEQQFYWPGMQRIISHSIRSCLTCEKFKPSMENTMAKL